METKEFFNKDISEKEIDCYDFFWDTKEQKYNKIPKKNKKFLKNIFIGIKDNCLKISNIIRGVNKSGKHL